MKSLKIIIVGNQYAELSDNQTVFTYKQFQNFAESESKISHLQNNYQIYLGQGLSDLTIDLIRHNIMTYNLRERFSFAAGQGRSKTEACSPW